MRNELTTNCDLTLIDDSVRPDGGFGHEDPEKLTEKPAVMFMAEAQWESTKVMPFAQCGTIDTHYWAAKGLRWKCKCRGKRFSVTSNIVFSDHKLPLTKILKIAFSWVNGAAGVSALELRRDWDVACAAVFTLTHKLREGITRGFDKRPLAGVHEMDGTYPASALVADIQNWRSFFDTRFRLRSPVDFPPQSN